MGYLTPEAAATYLETTKRSFVLGVVPQGQLLARLVALRLMCRPNDPALSPHPRRPGRPTAQIRARAAYRFRVLTRRRSNE